MKKICPAISAPSSSAIALARERPVAEHAERHHRVRHLQLDHDEHGEHDRRRNQQPDGV
jgi:hypothetical protein